MKRLTKSHNRAISGVLAGIAEYINPELDPVIVRLIYAIATVFNPLLIIVYLVMAVVLPPPSVSGYR